VTTDTAVEGLDICTIVRTAGSEFLRVLDTSSS
jgi:hypothetical protein